MRKEMRVTAFIGQRHEAAEKFLRGSKEGFRPGRGGARRVSGPKEVQLEFADLR